LRKALERIETPRLVLQRPRLDDVPEIFRRYAADHDVTRYLSWPAHETEEQTRAFVRFSDSEWRKWPAGPYLVFSRGGHLLGGTGLGFETPDSAATGYVFAKDAWGHGYATETLQAVMEIARDVGVRALHAICHVDHRASAHVLEKCGFTVDALLRDAIEFPNLDARRRFDVLRYSITL
jgi:RimJ/RimL family protein N-acetyltransferase